MATVDPPRIMEQGRIGWSPITRVGGTGSISTLGITEDDAAAAAKRRGPLGFAAAQAPAPAIYGIVGAPSSPGFDILVADAVRVQLAARYERVERDLRDIGECLWTARDTIRIIHAAGDLWVQYL